MYSQVYSTGMSFIYNCSLFSLPKLFVQNSLLSHYGTVFFTTGYYIERVLVFFFRLNKPFVQQSQLWDTSFHKLSLHFIFFVLCRWCFRTACDLFFWKQRLFDLLSTSSFTGHDSTDGFVNASVLQFSNIVHGRWYESDSE